MLSYRFSLLILSAPLLPISLLLTTLTLTIPVLSLPQILPAAMVLGWRLLKETSEVHGLV